MSRTALVALLGLALGAAQAAVAQPDPFAQTEPDINNGRFIAVGGFADTPPHAGRGQACMLCHGLDGSGDSAGAFPRLAGQGAWYLYKSLKDYASGVRPNDIMTPIAQALTDAEMQDVAAYYASIEEAPYPPAPEVDTRLLQRGGMLNAIGSAREGVQACVNCHGPEGRGLPPSFPRLAGQAPAYLEYQLQLWRDGTRQSDPMGVMELIARSLTPEDMRAVALYFASIRPPGARPITDSPEGAEAGEPPAGPADLGMGLVREPAADAEQP